MNSDDIEKVKSDISYGLFLNSLVVMVDFCVRHNKVEVIDQLKKISDDFGKSLTSEEQQAYMSEVERATQEKMTQFVSELEQNFTAEELKQLLPLLDTTKNTNEH